MSNQEDLELGNYEISMYVDEDDDLNIHISTMDGQVIHSDTIETRDEWIERYSIQNE